MARKRKRKHGASSLAVAHPNAAGIDIGSEAHYVAVPVDRCEQSVRKFSSFTPSLTELIVWLLECGIDTVAMESTSVYWVPLYEMLEEAGIQVFLVNAAHARNVPGRKSDVLDCQWLQQLHTYGLLRASFRPSVEICEMRTYFRQRDGLVKQASREIQRMQKALTLMNVQLHTVISDLTGKTGMAIVRDIVAGVRDPAKLAGRRDGRCRASIETIEASLDGNYRPEHVFALKQALSTYDHLCGLVRECDEAIAEVMKRNEPPSSKQLSALKERKQKNRRARDPSIDFREASYRLAGVDLTAVPGLEHLSVPALLAEIGTDMSPWNTSKHFGSWLRIAPGTKITGGKIISARTLPTRNRAAQIFRQAAVAAARTDTAIGAFFRRMRARKGTLPAVVATAYRIARIVYAMLKTRTPYEETGAAAFDEMHRGRVLRNLQRRAADFGLQLVDAPQPT